MGGGMTRERIGFIGLGLMGTGMALNLQAKGWPLTVWSRSAGPGRARLVAAGAALADSPAALAAASDIVILCVTGSAQVAQIVTGPQGLAVAGGPRVIVDCSTSDPSQTLRLAAELAPAGIALVDAPLGRTPHEAEAGTLDVMLGAPDDLVQRLDPVLRAIAGRVVHTGGVGTGHTMKLLNNFLSMGYAAIYAEALMLGRRAGLSPQVFDAVIRDGRMDCAFYRTFMRWTLDHDPDAHRFALRNGLKDLSYLLSLADSQGADSPVARAAHGRFDAAVAAGHGERWVPMLADILSGLDPDRSEPDASTVKKG